jgi:hypothetical protein
LFKVHIWSFSRIHADERFSDYSTELDNSIDKTTDKTTLKIFHWIPGMMKKIQEKRECQKRQKEAPVPGWLRAHSLFITRLCQLASKPLKGMIVEPPLSRTIRVLLL